MLGRGEGTRTREREFLLGPDQFKRLRTGEAIVINPKAKRPAEIVSVWPPRAAWGRAESCQAFGLHRRWLLRARLWHRRRSLQAPAAPGLRLAPALACGSGSASAVRR